MAGHRRLPVRAEAYALETELAWTRGTGPAGVRLRESADGSRHVDVGVHDGHVLVHRGATGHPTAPEGATDPKTESRTPLEPGARRVRLRIFVDRTSVEVFVGDGRHVHTSQIHPGPRDLAVTLFAEGGRARFSELVLRRFAPLGDG
ncbi:GH32 C-terminal domain-containing protein [Streptomyces sp. NPDC058374]|uniref:GH32 C-terminal domain-containing protein n=1 Tax=Streptomyces sp. NPDC058374 TaxID=3346466 RepID=UPI00365E95A0